MPGVSVIMSTYKEPEEYIRLSVESILHQSFSDLEFIIVIDNPQNEELLSLLLEYKNVDSRVIIIKNDRNIGLTASLNKALKEAKGELIARMDADDISDPERLKKQIEYLEANNLDLVGCSIRRISESGEILDKKTNKSYPPECIAKTLIYDDCIPHPTWIARKTLFDILNGYRELYSCEDYDFLLRALAKNYKFGICDEVLLSYRVNVNGISRMNSFRQHLSSAYLQKNINRISEINQDEIDSHIKKIMNEKRSIHYEKAIQQMNNGIKTIKNGHLVGLLFLCKAIVVSPYIADNLIRIAKMYIIRRQYT